MSRIPPHSDHGHDLPEPLGYHVLWPRDQVLLRLLQRFTGAEVIEEAYSATALSRFGEVALRYAEAGWPVFPLGVRRKLPLIPKTAGGHGHLDATDNPVQISTWWTDNPQANIGGRVPAGLIVLDIDPRHDGDRALANLEAVNGPLPVTLTSISGRGDGGQHLFFVHPGGDLTTHRLPAGIDLKTHTGYIVLPPSLHPVTGEPYHWANPTVVPAPLPDWLINLIWKPVPERTTNALVNIGDNYVAAAITNSVARILAAPDHQHSDVINAVSYGLGRLVGAGRLEEYQTFAALEDAARTLCHKDHSSSIRGGLAAGKNNPRSLTT
jgi:hypothetical protein